MTLASVSNPPLRLLAAFQQAYPECTPDHILQVPERDMWIAAAINETRRFDITALELKSHAVFTYQSAKLKQTVMRRPLPVWGRYPAGVVMLLSHTGLDLTGLTAVVSGDEPQGPRYEYGIGLAAAALYHTLHQRPLTADKLIELIDHVRRDYIGC